MRILTKIKNFLIKLQEDEVIIVASQMSYNLILSFFPFIIFLLTLIGHLPIDSDYVLLSLERLMPDEAYILIKNTVVEVVQGKNTDLLSFGILFTLFTGSAGIRGIIYGLNKAYNEKETRPIWKVFFMSVLFMIILAVMISASIILIVFGEMLGNALIAWLNLDNTFKINWNFYRYLVTLAMMFFTFSGIYYFMPSRRLKWTEVIIGSLFCTLGWIVASLGFAFYVNNFSNYSYLYGGLGAVIIFMTWIYITSIIILVGGEINAYFAKE